MQVCGLRCSDGLLRADAALPNRCPTWQAVVEQHRLVPQVFHFRVFGDDVLLALEW
jgi:hypothetical protein